MSAGEGTAVIGKSVRIVGNVSGSEDLQLEGELQGSIELPGSRLTLGASGLVRGNVIAQEVVVLGRMEGDIRAKGRVELRSSANVIGNIYAGTLGIEENATFRGQVDPLRSGEALPQGEAAAPARPTSFAGAVAAVAARGVSGGSPSDQGATKPSAAPFSKP